jgi:hypothetical protein
MPKTSHEPPSVDLLPTRAGSPTPRGRRSQPRPRPALIIALALTYLAAAYAAVIAVDVMGLGREQLLAISPERRALWVHLFEDASPTEFLQWAALGAIVILAASLSGAAKQARRTDASAFWRLASVGALLMLLEDAGNVRHRLAHYADLLGLLDAPGPWHLAVEAAWFGVIALVLVVAVVRFSGSIGASRRTVAYGLSGAIAYAMAATMSATRDVGWWYADAGRWIQESLLRADLLVPEGWVPAHVHFFLMDYVVEETIELIGASLLLAAVLAHRRDSARRLRG